MAINHKEAIERVLKTKKALSFSNSNLALWTGWYKGKVNSFHNYTMYNGKETLKLRKKSMQAAKRVCEDWASLLMSEKVQVVSNSDEKLKKLLDDLDFQQKENKAVELGFALSLSAVVADITGEIDELGNIANPEIDITVHSANKIVPITIKNGHIVECAFAADNITTVDMALHTIGADGNYEITKIKVDKTTNKEIISNSIKLPFNTPLFHIVYPNIVNNIDVDSPFPISIFANAIDTLEALDNKYDSYNNEFVLGRKRVYVAADAFNVNKQTGQVERVFDPFDPLLYNLPQGTNKDGSSQTLIKTDVDLLRAIEHQLGIQDELNYLAQKVGLGNEYYRLEKGRVMTATQVISEKSDTFRNKKRHELAIKRGLVVFVRSLMKLQNALIEQQFSDGDIESVDVRFDDSIIEDTEAQKISDRTDVTNGVMSRVEYRMKWYGESEEQAIETTNKYFGNIALINRINAFIPALQTGAMTVEQFVSNVYIDDKNQAKLIGELTELQNKQGAITAEDLAGVNLDIQP